MSYSLSGSSVGEGPGLAAAMTAAGAVANTARSCDTFQLKPSQGSAACSGRLTTMLAAMPDTTAASHPQRCRNCVSPIMHNLPTVGSGGSQRILTPDTGQMSLPQVELPFH